MDAEATQETLAGMNSPVGWVGVGACVCACACARVYVKLVRVCVNLSGSF